MSIEYYYIAGINPEPWTAPNFSRGKGGKPNVYKSASLATYQEALQDEFRTRYPDAWCSPDGVNVSLTFAFWRELADYEIGDGKKSSRNIADATNLQKATEDALQGLLYENDRDVVHAESYVCEQGADVEPGILIVTRLGGSIPNLSRFDRQRTALSYASRPDPRKNIRPAGDVRF